MDWSRETTPSQKKDSEMQSPFCIIDQGCFQSQNHTGKKLAARVFLQVFVLGLHRKSPTCRIRIPS
eukprot:25210_1